jgi:hypothetical protein
MQSLNARDASQRLEQARSIQLATPRDRRIYGFGTCGFGLLLGGSTFFASLEDAIPLGSMLPVAVYLPLACGLALWQTRAASTVPRHAKRVGYIGLAISVVSAMAARITFNVVEGSFAIEAGVIALAATPLVIAGLIVADGRLLADRS